VDPSELKNRVMHLARRAGFDRAGVAPASALPPDRVGLLESWIQSGRAAGMEYFRRNAELRAAPDRLVPQARSVLCLAVGCAPGPHADEPDGLRVARYARGRDYHKVLKRMCHGLMDRIREVFPDLTGRAFVDSAPVMEKSLAVLAGLGWVGRHGLLIVPSLGSYVLLAEIISNLPLPPDSPRDGQCGPCRRCIEACPTGALLGDGLVDARRCISYWNKGGENPPPREILEGMNGWICGCDSCQEACPHNGAVPAGSPALRGYGPELPPPAELLRFGPEDWDRFTRGRGLRVVSYDQMLCNVIAACVRAGDASCRSALEDLARRRADLAERVQWALDSFAATDG
jgi:epoxyqueuosine reductase